MKKLFTILFVSVFAFTSCSDDGAMGPQGPQGPPGEDGLDGLGYTFEETVDLEYFADSNLYSSIIDIPNEVGTINPEADAVLVYRLEIVEGNDGQDLDAWSLIPQNFFLEEGIIQYVYNHTVGDVEIFIDGNFDLSNLDTGYTQGQTFRIVVVPSDWISENINTSDINEVLNAFDVQEYGIQWSGND